MNATDFFKIVPEPIKIQASKAGMKLYKHSPEILLGVGIVGIGTGVVLACRATLKADEVLDDFEANMNTIDICVERRDEGLIKGYSDKDELADRAAVYVKTGAQFARLYAPAIACLGLGIFSIMASHGIMQKRAIALTAAYETVSNGFAAYRKNVQERYGDEADRELRFGLSEDKIVKETKDPETGKVKKEKSTVTTFDGSEISSYARWFDIYESPSKADRNPEYNRMVLTTAQSYWNNRLNSIGYVFLNDVYEDLGLSRTKEGQIVGWMKGNGGDDFIDFGLFEARNRQSWNGEDPDGVNSFLLDFNVDGPIIDKI